MRKTSFVTSSMISLIAEAVDIRQGLHQATEDLLSDRMLSQVAAELAQGAMSTSDRHSIYYRGPAEFKPAGMPVTTPWGGCEDGATDATTADGAATALAQVECA